MLRQGKVRRYLPNSEVIAANVIKVMLDYKNVVDTVNQLPLLTSEVWDSFSGEPELPEQNARGFAEW